MPKGSITLHPTKGVNPRISCCFRCGKDVGLVLLGNKELISICNDCSMHHVGYGKLKECQRCHSSNIESRILADSEKVYTEMCKECSDETKKFDEEVRKGGIYWRCSNCRANGVIIHTSELAQEVRLKEKIPAPKPIGIQFNKEDCPSCQKK